MPDLPSTGVQPRLARAADAAFADILARIAAGADAIEAQRRIPPALASDMVDAGLFRLLLPRSLGGGEVDYLDYLAMTQTIAQADGSAGWCFNQNNILATMATLMPRPLAEEIWRDPRAVLCNGPPQHARAEPAEGGYRLTGRWNFSSGSPHATWVVAVLRAADTEALTCIIPKEQVDFGDSWQVNGLRGTGSFSFSVEDHFVPAERCYVEAAAPSEDGPLYKIPRGLFFGSGFGAVALGVARAALDAAVETALRKTPQEQTLLRDQPAVQASIGHAEALWSAADAYLRQQAAQLWRSAQELPAIPMDDRARLRLASTHAIRQAAAVVDLAYEVFGATAIFESSPIQRRYQDIHAITQQIQGRMEHYQTVGQHLLGLEPRARLL